MEFADHEKQKSARPKQVTYAVFFLTAALVIGFIFDFVTYPLSLLGGYESGIDLFTIVCTAFGYLLSFVIIAKIAAGRNWARLWLLVGFTLNLFYIIFSIQPSAEYLQTIICNGFFRLIELIAIVLLFQSQSNAWFKSNKSHAEPGYPFAKEPPL